ncbi:hypothetical protein ACNKF0_21065 [Nocardioides sp. T5]|uniref:hypothetical protein n=1 Tax=Nocardioides sp. T5 TaxID=3400182 RepID=UPI003A85B47E
MREIVRSGLHDGRADPGAGRLTLLVLVALLVSGITEPMLTVPLGWWSLLLVTALSRQRVVRRPLPGVDVLEGERVSPTDLEARGVTTP